jgi:rhomboid family GlyGly-CTERM serine protease
MGMAIICLIIAMLFSYADENLIFNADKIQQFWRFITAHLVHTDHYHLLGNLLAFALLIYLFPISWQKQIQVFIIAMVFIDIYLILFSIDFYAGLSGLIYAIPGAYFFKLLKQKRYTPALIIVFILLLYVFIISPQTSQIQSNSWQPLKAAHLLGFLSGIFVLFLKKNKSL